MLGTAGKVRIGSKVTFFYGFLQMEAQGLADPQEVI